jgi:hypothetical protein
MPENAGSIELGHYVLGLPNDVLQDIAEKASSGPVSSVDPAILPRDWPEYGCCGEKCIISLSNRSIFVKRQSGHSGFKETPHYEYLNGIGLPVPTLYGSLLDDQDMEVLFLEDVDPNTQGSKLLESPHDLAEFFSLAAKINALQPVGDYGSSLYYFAKGRGIEKGMQSIDAIWSTAASGEFGPDLVSLCSTTKKDDLLSLSTSLSECLSELKRGYAHNEYVPMQIGRRGRTGEMVVFDLRTTGLGPRFIDVAPWLGDPGKIDSSDLADHYLQEYSTAGGASVSKEVLMSETRMLWQARVISGLNRSFERVLTANDPGPETGSGGEKTRDHLLQELTRLLETLPVH